MAAFTNYKALDFSGFDEGIGRIGKRFKEDRENEAILKYLESQGGQKKEGTSLSNLDADYGKTDTVAKPSPIQNNPLPKLGVQVAENEEDTQRLEAQMAAGQGAFARPQAQMPQQQGTDLARLFSTKENEFGLPPGYLAKTAQVESGGNPSARNPNSSATGLFQFVKSTGQQYGLTNPLDPVASTDAAARLAADNKRALTQALGREPTAGELYLAHQQGAGGAAKLLANADAPAEAVVGPEAFRLNGGQPGMTAGQFAQKWTSKVDGPGQQGGTQVAQADMPAQGAAEAQGFAVPGGMQPANRQNIDVQALKGLIQAGGAARQLGLQLFQQAQTGKNFGFMTGQDGAIYATDPRSGQVRRVTEPTRSQAQELDLQTKRLEIQKRERELGQTAAPTTKVIKQADGSEVAVQWDPAGNRWAPLAAPEGGEAVRPKGPTKLTEAQSKDLIYHSRGLQALEAFEPLAGAYASGPERVASAVPGGNYVVSEDYQKAEQAGRNFLASVLRKDTGAAVTPSEEVLYGQIFLPQPGDKPGTLAQKSEARKQAIDAIRGGMGTAEVLALGKRLTTREPGQDAPAPQAAPQQAPASRQPARSGAGPTAINPRTGERVMWNGQAWVPAT